MRISLVRTVAIGAFAALALGACGSSSKSSSGTSDTTQAPATTAPAPATTAGGTTSGSGATVSVASATVKDFGTQRILVDSNGMTLYVYDKDASGKSSCTGQCATAWPPLMATGSETYGTGLTASMFSTITRDDGSKQLAVNGKPLYTWQGDTKPGDTTGQDVNSFYTVGANGNKLDKG
jgi:predicted lipoprotein with Yx(FWY)xxD motif